jgi:hypothetical protein
MTMEAAAGDVAANAATAGDGRDGGCPGLIGATGRGGGAGSWPGAAAAGDGASAITGIDAGDRTALEASEADLAAEAAAAGEGPGGRGLRFVGGASGGKEPAAAGDAGSIDNGHDASGGRGAGLAGDGASSAAGAGVCTRLNVSSAVGSNNDGTRG